MRSSLFAVLTLLLTIVLLLLVGVLANGIQLTQSVDLEILVDAQGLHAVIDSNTFLSLAKHRQFYLAYNDSYLPVLAIHVSDRLDNLFKIDLSLADNTLVAMGRHNVVLTTSRESVLVYLLTLLLK